jgi:hyperosmotically inducible protein
MRTDLRFICGLTVGTVVVFMANAAAVTAQARAGEPAKPATQSAERTPGQNPVKDGWITFKIHSAYVPDNLLEGSDIDVTTRAGVVTLAGTVPSEASRARAISIAKSTEGAKSVTDSLRIAPAKSDVAAATGAAKSTARAAGRSVNDGWIKSKIYAQFLTDWSVFEDSDIDIDVANGAVALNGTVKTAAAKTRAVAIAKATDGVGNVKDNLHVGAAH